MTRHANASWWLGAIVLSIVALTSILVAGPREVTPDEVTGTPRHVVVVALAAAAAYLSWLLIDQRPPRTRDRSSAP